MEGRKNNKGFTLVEVIVASLILIVAILPIASSFVVAERMNTKGRVKEQAMTVAQNIVESVKGLGAKTCHDLAKDGKSGIIGTGTMKLNVTTDHTEKKPENQTGRDIMVEGAKKHVDWYKYDYEFDLTGVLMGQTYYDAKVSVRLDDTDDVNVLAYSYSGTYKEFDLPVMEYFVVDVKVSAQGSSNVLATYSGSFLTKN